MSEGAISALDIVILILLGITIFYAARLSVYLRAFRDGRSDLEKLIRNLSQNIDKAEEAIAGLKNATNSAGKDLQETINESKFLSDELRFMNEAGDNLASRLEKLAERNSELVELIEESGGIGASVPYSEKPKAVRKEPEVFRDEAEEDFPAGFAIQDRDYMEDEGFYEEEDDDFFFAEEEVDVPEGLHSRAERDLYEALHRSQRPKKKAGGMA